MSLLISEVEMEQKVEASTIVYKRLGKGSDSSPRPRSEHFKSGIPNFVREIMAGEERADIATQKEIGDSWGVSGTAVRYAGEGRVGAHQKKGELEDLDKVADAIAQDIVAKTIESANRKLFDAIDSIDVEKVKDEKPIAQTVIARNLASVIEKLSPKAVNQTNIQFNVYTPPTKSLEEFGTPIRIIEETVKR